MCRSVLLLGVLRTARKKDRKKLALIACLWSRNKLSERLFHVAVVLCQRCFCYLP